MNYKINLAAAALLLTLAAPAVSRAQTTVFDSVTGVTGYSLPTATRTFLGEPFSPGNYPAGVPLTISGFQVELVSAAAVTYTDVVLNVEFWSSWNGGSASPVFSGGSGVFTFDLGATTLALNTVYDITATFPTPLTLTGNAGSPYGVTFNWQGNTGSGLVNTDNLTTAVRGAGTNPGPAVGTVGFAGPNFGYYRNVAGQTTFNFASTDSRNIGANSALAFKLFSPVPEPGTVTLLVAGGAGLVGLVARRRRA